MGVSYNPKIVTDGLIGYWDAANKKSYPGSGTTWNDLSGNGNSGTLTNGPTFDSSNGGSILFDGTNDTINCGTASQIGSALTGLTVSAWIKTSVAATKIIAENGTLYNTNTFYLAQENSNSFSFSVYGSGQQDLILTPGSYTTNIWYNLTGVWSSGQRIKLYINDNQSTGGTVQGSAQTTLINGNTNLFIGSRAGTSFFFAGNIANVKIYNRALSAEEIVQNFNAMRGRFGI